MSQVSQVNHLERSDARVISCGFGTSMATMAGWGRGCGGGGGKCGDALSERAERAVD